MHKELSMIFLVVVLLTPEITHANHDTLVIPQTIDTASWFQIPTADLLANDGAGAALVSFTATTRGTLQPTLGGFEYKPHDAFFQAGLDSFSYVHNAATGERSIVFLIPAAETDPVLSSSMQLEVDEATSKITMREGSLGAVNTAGVEADFYLTAPAGGSGHLYANIPDGRSVFDGPINEGSSGSSCDLDPNGFSIPPGDEVSIGSITVDGQVNMQLQLSQEPSGYVLAAQTWRDDGTRIRALSAPFVGPTPLWISLWPASAPGILDGGLALQFGNRVVASRSGLDNVFDIDTQQVEVRMGLVDGVGTGTLVLSSPTFWMGNLARPSLVPVFADGGESGDTSVWSGKVGFPGVSQIAALHGDRGFAVAPPFASYLIDETPFQLPHYRARFTLDPAGLHLNDGSNVTLLRALSGGTKRFDLLLTRKAGQLKVCIAAQENSGASTTLDCAPIDSQSRHSLAVLWWADAGTGLGGGMKLYSYDLTQLSHRAELAHIKNVQNADQEIDTVHFGVVSTDATSFGTFYLDDFESWR
ncbi:MAG: hypothetical protein AAF657_32165 [Acidobacteriota bacterium]